MKIKLFLILITSVLFSENTSSIRTQLISEGFSRPLLVRFHPETNSMFVIEQTGQIKLIEKNKITTFIDLSELVLTGPIPDERGLLGMALHPDFSKNGLFYVSYVDKNNFSVVARYFYDSIKQKTDYTSESKLFHFEQPYGNHNGGHLEFGPEDNFLYLGFGDGGSSGDPQNNAQRLDNFLGKILRIDVNTEDGYLIPESNPYINEKDKLNEIWVYGLRNPWRFSFDRQNGDLYIGDVGQYLWEEINRISSNQSNVNFGNTYIEQYLGEGTLGQIVNWIVKIILSILLYYIVNLTFVLIVSIVASPFNDALSARIEKQVQEKSLPGFGYTLESAFSRFVKTIGTEIKKIVMILGISVIVIVMGFFPLLTH